MPQISSVEEPAALRSRGGGAGGGQVGGGGFCLCIRVLNDRLVELLLSRLRVVGARVLHERPVDAQHGEHLDLLRAEQRVALIHDEVAQEVQDVPGSGSKVNPVNVGTPAPAAAQTSKAAGKRRKIEF